MIRRDEVHTMPFDDVSTGPALRPMTPGEVLLEEFMRALGLSARGLATELQWPPNRISSIVNGSREITAETALRLTHRFQATSELLMKVQTAHDLAVARTQMGLAA